MKEKLRHRKVIFVQPRALQQSHTPWSAVKQQLQRRGIPLTTLSVPGWPAMRHLPFRTNLLRYMWQEYRAFQTVWRYKKHEAVVYSPGLQSIGATIAAGLSGKQVVYHLCTPPSRNSLARKLLSCFSQPSRTRTLFASHHLKEQYGSRYKTSQVVYFGLSAPFQAKVLREGEPKRAYPFTLLMRSASAVGESINRYIELARSLPDMQFMLQIEAPLRSLRNLYPQRAALPENLIVYSAEKSPHRYLRHAHLLIDLQAGDANTSGNLMILQEAMAYGLPAISNRSRCEVLQHERNGLLLPYTGLEQLVNGIKQLSANRPMYNKLAKGARQTAEAMTEERMVDEILSVLGFTEKEGQPVVL